MFNLIADLTALPVWLLCGAPVALVFFGIVLALPYLKRISK